MSNDPKAIARLFASKFVARPDVKAIQTTNGYMPHGRWSEGKCIEYFPWSMQDMIDHIERKKTFGHYLLSPESQVKLFAFDVDLEKDGCYEIEDGYAPFNPRESWLNRAHPGRAYMKYQFHEIAHKLGKTIESELDIQWAAAYSGGKGVHVYGFTGLIPADDARDGAHIVLDALGFEASKGDNFFKHEDYQNMSVELFPKQGSLDGKDFGNLMRLPLGRNLKNLNEPTFFMDMTAPMGTLAPLDPEYALTTASQWRMPGE